MYVDAVATELDIEESGLLDGLEGEARRERAELIAWLFDRGFTAEQIRANVSPILVASNRVLGDDGDYVSAREICEKTGIELDLLQRLQRAVGLPRIDDPDAAVLLRVDAEAAARATYFLGLGIDEEQVIVVVRVLAEGLARAAEAMRHSAADGDSAAEARRNSSWPKHRKHSRNRLARRSGR